VAKGKGASKWLALLDPSPFQEEWAFTDMDGIRARKIISRGRMTIEIFEPRVTGSSKKGRSSRDTIIVLVAEAGGAHRKKRESKKLPESEVPRLSVEVGSFERRKRETRRDERKVGSASQRLTPRKVACRKRETLVLESSRFFF